MSAASLRPKTISRALFTARSASLYLRGAGRLAFVLPLAALSRGQFERCDPGRSTARDQWDEAWTMDDSVRRFFRAVLRGVWRRRATSKPMPKLYRAYSGDLPLPDAPEALVDRLIGAGKIKLTENTPSRPKLCFPVARLTVKRSARARHRAAHALFVERKALGRVGADATAPLVVSRRNSQEKKPWKSLSGIEIKWKPSFCVQLCSAKASCLIAFSSHLRRLYPQRLEGMSSTRKPPSIAASIGSLVGCERRKWFGAPINATEVSLQ